MAGLWLMLPLAVILALVFLGLFFWTVRNGEYEDPEMERYRLLFEEDGGAEDLPSRAPTGVTAPRTGDSL